MPSTHPKRVKVKSRQHGNRSSGDMLGCGTQAIVILTCVIAVSIMLFTVGI